MRSVKELRTRLRLSQTAFGQKIGKGLTSVLRYETVRPPRGIVLHRLQKLSEERNFEDLAAIFRHELAQDVGIVFPASIQEATINEETGETTLRRIALPENFTAEQGVQLQAIIHYMQESEPKASVPRQALNFFFGLEEVRAKVDEIQADDGETPPVELAYQFLLDNPECFLDGDEWPADMPHKPNIELIAGYYLKRLEIEQ